MYEFAHPALSVIVDGAVAGMGLAWVPDGRVQEQLARGSLIRMVGEHRLVPLETSAVCAANQAMPLRSRLAVDLMVERLPLVVPG
jgi:DNA-binding transcriptional LysR family regulator